MNDTAEYYLAEYKRVRANIDVLQSECERKASEYYAKSDEAALSFDRGLWAGRAIVYEEMALKLVVAAVGELTKED